MSRGEGARRSKTHGTPDALVRGNFSTDRDEQPSSRLSQKILNLIHFFIVQTQIPRPHYSFGLTRVARPNNRSGNRGIAQRPSDRDLAHRAIMPLRELPQM